MVEVSKRITFLWVPSSEISEVNQLYFITKFLLTIFKRSLQIKIIQKLHFSFLLLVTIKVQSLSPCELKALKQKILGLSKLSNPALLKLRENF